jgi:hypothetical protein
MADEPNGGGPGVWRSVGAVLRDLGLSLLAGVAILSPLTFWLLPGPLGAVAAVVIAIVVGYVCLLVYYYLEDSGWWKH